MRRLGRLQPRRRLPSRTTPRLVSCPLARNTRWEMDLKCEVLADGRWGFLMAIIDACDRQVPAWRVGDHCRADEAIAVLEAALLARFDGPVPDEGVALELRVDRGPQFIARRSKTAAKTLGVQLAFCGVRASNDKPFIKPSSPWSRPSSWPGNRRRSTRSTRSTLRSPGSWTSVMTSGPSGPPAIARRGSSASSTRSQNSRCPKLR